MRCFIWICVALGVASIIGPARAGALADEPSAQPAVAVAPPAEQIERWLSELASDTYAVREAAQRNLVRAGGAAIDPLVAAADNAGPEARARRMAALQRLCGASDGELAARAEQGLRTLSGSDHLPTACAAEKALARKEQADVEKRLGDLVEQARPVRARRGFARVATRVVVADAGVAIKAGSGARSIESMVVNGRRTIKVKQPDLKVEISDGGEDGIKMSVTKIAKSEKPADAKDAEETDGKKTAPKETTEKFAIKDAKELKEKHPEAFKLYEQFAAERDSLRIEAAPAAAPDIKHVDGPRIERRPAR